MFITAVPITNLCVYYCSTYYEGRQTAKTSIVGCRLSYPRARKGSSTVHQSLSCSLPACVYYCSTYYKAVREGGGGEVEDMCYERLRAEAYVN